RGSSSRASRIRRSSTAFTYGQWLQMNITTSTGLPLKSSRAYVLPSTAGGRKSGHFAPSSGGGVSTAQARGILAQIGVEGRLHGERERGQDCSRPRAIRRDPGQAARDRRAAGGWKPSARGQPSRVRGGHGAVPPRHRDPRRRREEGGDVARRG